jgi:hypothetical protein
MSKGTKILFLDFDGVLHPKGANAAHDHFSKKHLLEELLLEPELSGVQVVISSTWREAYSLDRLRLFFSPRMQTRIVDRTPVLDDLDGEFLRYREVRGWLNRHPLTNAWFALDDDREGFPPSQSRNVVFTNPSFGVTESQIADLRSLLSKAPTNSRQSKPVP